MRIFIILLFLAGSAFANSYSTNFPTGEMNGWIQGKTAGINWCNVINTPGFAFGTQNGSQPYDDSTAVLPGSWGNDQSAQATVSVPSPGGQTAEVEIRLRTSISAGRIAGYEFNASVASNQAYMQIVRWNGPLNSFQQIGGQAVYAKSGDVLMARAQGNTLTWYKNGAVMCSANDGTFPSGAPGIGFYSQNSGINSSFGFSSFSATDNGSPAPLPTPTPTATPQGAYSIWETSLINQMRSIGVRSSQINQLQSWLSGHPPNP